MPWFDRVLAFVDPEVFRFVLNSRQRVQAVTHSTQSSHTLPPTEKHSSNSRRSVLEDDDPTLSNTAFCPTDESFAPRTEMVRTRTRVRNSQPSSATNSGRETGFSLQHGILTHLLTPWDIVFAMLVRRRVLGLIAVLALLLLLFKPGFSLPGSRGQVFVWSSICQAAFMGAILISQRIAKSRAKAGKEFAARVLLVPAFETILWTLFVLTVCDLNLMTEASPKYPHFFEVYYDDSDDGEIHAIDPLENFAHMFFDSEIKIWFIAFLFIENTLSRSSLKKALKRSVLMSILTATICTFGYLVEVAWDVTTVSVLAMWTSRDLLGLGICVWLIFKATKSSRRSVIPFAAVTCLSCIFSMLVSITRYNSVSTSLRDPFITIYVVFSCIVFNISLFWTLYLDTMYWRGVTRIPVWCAHATFSPYDQIDDSLIQRQIPSLVDQSSIEFIDFAFLEFGPLLGAGATSRVFKGKICYGKYNGKRVAIKVFTPMEITYRVLTEFANEIQKFEHLRHERLMGLIGVCIRPPDICMVCELCERGSLHEFLRSDALTQKDKMRLCVQVCEAVAFIHNLSPPLIHRDLKSHNFLVTSEGDIKLSDFGTSRALNYNRRRRALSTRVGSLPWMSPEVLASHDDYDLKADIYSVGVVLWEIWAKADPHGGVHHTTIESLVLAGGRPHMPSNCPPKVAQLIQEMWLHDPRSRPTAALAVEILKGLQAEMQGGAVEV